MVPARLLTLALFSSAVVAVVWWKRRHAPAYLEVVKRTPPEVPWVDVV